MENVPPIYSPSLVENFNNGSSRQITLLMRWPKCSKEFFRRVEQKISDDFPREFHRDFPNMEVRRMKIGAGVSIITPKSPMAMAGYSARHGNSTGTHDELKARAISLSLEGKEIAIVVCDLLAVGEDLVAEIRGICEATLGIPASNIMISATHTHQGPMGVSKYLDDTYPPFLVKKVVEAITQAKESQKNGKFRFVENNLTSVSQNRRNPEGPIEEVLKVLLATDQNDEVIASVMAYACHPTILENDNFLFSADFPGVANALLEKNLGGTSLFLQGTCGDLNPTWTAHDYANVKLNGEIVGASALVAALESMQVGTDRRAVNLSWSLDTPQTYFNGSSIGKPTFKSLQKLVKVDRGYPDNFENIDNDVSELEASLAADSSLMNVKSIQPKLSELRSRRNLWRRPNQRNIPGSDELEIQVIQISQDCAFVGLPGEFLVEVGKEIQRRSPIKNTIVVGYANGYYEYFPLSKHFAEHGYEIGASRYVKGSTEKMIDASIELLNAL
ncbi:MAG: hypothetical protein F2762_02500 [Actinobacteria bacterium]|nr:hypothetical protein [Actinomycetota bacterium]